MSGTTAICRAPETAALDAARAFASAHGRLAGYLGPEEFASLAAAYLAGGQTQLVEFLGNTPPWSRNPEIAEFARLELALSAACTGPRGSHLKQADIDAIAPSKLERTAFAIDARAKRFQFRTNVTSLWSCVACAEHPPRPERRREPIDVLVWQQGGGARFRILGREEALALDAVAAGKTYAEIRAEVGRTAEAPFAQERMRGYLRGWIEAELISALRSPVPARPRK